MKRIYAGYWNNVDGWHPVPTVDFYAQVYYNVHTRRPSVRSFVRPSYVCNLYLMPRPGFEELITASARLFAAEATGVDDTIGRYKPKYRLLATPTGFLSHRLSLSIYIYTSHSLHLANANRFSRPVARYAATRFYRSFYTNYIISRL